MINQDKRIYALEDLIKTHFGYCKINKAREDIRIFYGKSRNFCAIAKSDLINLSDAQVINRLFTFEKIPHGK